MDREQKIHKIQDIDTIARCVSKFNASAPRAISSRVGSLQAFVEKLADHAENYLFNDNGDIVGFISFYANRPDEAYLSMIAVDSTCKKKGVGTALLNTAIEGIAGRKIPFFKLEVDNKNIDAIRFYKKHGFTILRPASEISIYMRKELSLV